MLNTYFKKKLFTTENPQNLKEFFIKAQNAKWSQYIIQLWFIINEYLIYF